MNCSFNQEAIKSSFHLSKATHNLANRALQGEFGNRILESASIKIDDAIRFNNWTNIQKYTYAIQEIASKAPVLMMEGELITGSASLGNAIRHVVPVEYEGKDVFDSVSHLTPGFDKILREGLVSTRVQITERINRGNLSVDEASFLEGLLKCLNGFGIWHQRYLDEIEQFINESEGETKKRYIDLYKNLKNVPENPPSSFREALQSLWFQFSFLRLCGNWPGIGRMDQMLGDFLKSDLASNAITLDEARELVAHFWIKGCEWITGEKTISGDAQHYQNIVLAGIDENGLEVANEVTYLILDVVEELGISDFPIAVRLNKQSPRRLLERIAQVQQRGGGIVAVYNEDLIIKSLIDFGYEEREARTFANDGCWEVQIPGKTCFAYAPMNILSILQNNVIHINESGEVDYETFEDLYAAFKHSLENAVDEFHHFADSFATSSSPSLLIALFTEGCIEKARDYFNRGPVYTVLSPHAGLLPDTANSLLAIQKFVFEEKLMTFNDLRNHLKDNWNNAEDIRRHITNSVEYYGNDNASADAMTKRVLHDFIDCVLKIKERNGVLRPAGVSTFGRQVDWSSSNGATASGRQIGDVLSGNLSPTPGTDKNGATSIIRSYCLLGLDKLTCGAALDIKLMPSSVNGEDSVDTLVSLMLGFITLGGFFMQIDVIDNSILIDAQKHPEKYRNLAVRISGWSARFASLDRSWQDMIINRTAH